MTILTEIRESKKLAEALRQPSIPLLSFSITEMLGDIRTDFFSELEHDIRIHFVTRGPLACIDAKENAATIYIHQLLNHIDTPPEVFSLILKHQLLHLWVPPTSINGKLKQHPPEFWDAEKTICPERRFAWIWMRENLSASFHRRPRLERIDVGGNWKEIWNQPKTEYLLCQYPPTTGDEQIDEDGW